MPPISIRVRATTPSGGFHRGPLHLSSHWSDVDLERPDVREALIAHVGVHVRVHPNDHQVVRDAGFAFKDGRMVPERTPNAAAPAAATASAPSSAPTTTSSPPARGRKERATAA